MTTTATKTYMPIGDVPQRVLDGCKDEFGMDILYHKKRDILVVAGSSDRYCPDCDEYVDAVQEIGITWVTDKDESECEWDEIGDEFCPDCLNDVLADDKDEYWEGMREDYYAERALDRWRGLD